MTYLVPKSHDRRIRRIATSGVSALALITSSQTVFAQDSASPEEEVEEEAIVVTGSRLATNKNSPQPLTSLNEEAFEATGALTVSEAINELPQLGNSLESGFAINGLNGGFGIGTQTINLRNLGANRTLVLVNGRRHVGGDIGTSAVDLNSIPAGLVEAIDIVTGASSAVYGADAVTGVVNIRLKQDYEGTELSFRVGSTTEGDGEEYSIGGVHGGIFSGGDYVIAAEYTKQDEILGGDRSFGQFDGSAATGTAGVDFGSGVNPGGLFAFSGGGTGGFDVNGNFVQPFSERFQRVPFRSLQNDTERFVVSGRVGIDVNDDVKAFFESTFANSITEVQFEPQLAIFSDAGFASSGTAGFRFPTAPTVNIPELGGTLRPITRRFSEFGPRRAEIDRNLFRLAAGLDGNFSSGAWQFSYQYGRVETTQTDFDTINKLDLTAAIDPVACAATPGCVPIDIFGRNTINPAALASISSDLESRAEGEQHVFNAFITSELFDFGGNAVSIVVGAEYRNESATITPASALLAVVDPITGSGNLVGLQGTRTFFGNTNGEFDVIEGFAELAIPFTDRINVNLSGRVSDYSTVGTEVTFGANVNWEVNDLLRVRASYGRAIRAPNINELFAPDRASTTAIADPCDTLTDGGVALTPAAGCGAFVGAGFNPTDLEQQIRGETGGNPNLDAETADAITAGIVFTPGNSTTISLDYYQIDLEDVLAPSFSAQATLERCIATGDSFFCDNITRDPVSNVVTSIRSEQVNLASEKVSGIDVALQHRFDLAGGELNFNILYSYLFEHDRQVNDTVATEDLAGRVDNLEHRVNASAQYEINAFTFGTTVRWLDSAVQNIAVDSELVPGNRIGSATYVDAFADYKITDNVKLRVGVENIFDEEPPIITNLFEGGASADTTLPGVYDIRGTFGYATLKLSF